MPAVMPVPELHVVTGAFGYSGRYITARLLEAGRLQEREADYPGVLGKISHVSLHEDPFFHETYVADISFPTREPGRHEFLTRIK